MIIQFIVLGLLGVIVVLLGILAYQGNVMFSELRRRQKVQAQARARALPLKTKARRLR